MESKLHAELVYQIRKNNKWNIDEEEIERLKNLNIDTEKTLRSNDLEKILRKFWEELKFKNKKLYSGTVVKILPNGKAGFIKEQINNNSFYFRINSFKGNRNSLKEGLNVSFYLERGFDRKKNEKTLNAVNILPIN
ncbi:MAG: cold shock domain-containing protein [Methanobrevibacter sp.]|nr:cold shock domain-containing protein [Methanobrevibacter sp.]